MKLVIEDEAGTRSVVPLADEPIVVGRAAEGVTLRLGDRNVSRRHARFLRQNGAVFVEDLGSLTGTRVNGERITGKRRLREGDLVQIGDYDLAVVAAEAAAAGAGPDAPPPLPAASRDPNAITVRLPPVAEAEPVPPPPAAPAARGRSTLKLALAAGAVALALGVAAGLALGALTAPAPPALTRP